MTTWVERQRSNLTVAPKDIADFETLRPKDASPAIIRLSNMLQRHAAKAQALKSTKTIKINPFHDDEIVDEEDENDEGDVDGDRKSTRLNSSHYCASRMPSSA